MEKVEALAGHESLETTRRYYQPSYHDFEKAVMVIGEQLKQISTFGFS